MESRALKVSAQDRNFIELVIVALLIALMLLLAAHIGNAGTTNVSMLNIGDNTEIGPFCYKACTLIQP